jgi:hypothetical protein
MKTAISIIITIFLMALLAIYIVFQYEPPVFIEEGQKIEDYTIPGEQDYCSDSEGKKDECVFEYREIFVCADQSKKREDIMLVVFWNNGEEEVSQSYMSSQQNRCIYYQYYTEVTPEVMGKGIYEKNIDLFQWQGRNSVVLYVDGKCSMIDRQEDVCRFKINSFKQYIEDLGIETGDVESRY